jgi:hypothetical protein
MSNETNKGIKTGESFEVALNSRGAMGLKMQFKTEPDGVVSVKQLESRMGAATMAGDAIKVVFRITGERTGNTTVTFFETQPWDKDFPPIVAEVVRVGVVE